MRKKITIKKEVLYGLGMYLLVFQSVLQNYISVFKYLDEILAGVVFLCGIYAWIKSGYEKFSKWFWVFVIGIGIFAVMGIVSSIVFQYQSLKISVLQFLLSTKYFMLMIGTICLGSFSTFYEMFDISKNVARKLLLVIVGWQIIAFFITVIPSFAMWDLCGKVVFLVCIVLWNYEGNTDLLYLLVGCALLLSTDSAKGLGAITLIIALFLYVVKARKKINIVTLAALGGLLLCVGWESIVAHYIDGLSKKFPRPMLLVDGIRVANEHFPLGSGWGTFGSHYAAEVYSPVYYTLGWDKIHDLKPERSWFLKDTYWPSVYAETGWIGFVGFCIALIMVYVMIQKQYEKNVYKYAAGMLALGYMMITTFEEVGFAQPVLMPIAIVLGLMCAKEKI